MTEYLFVLCLSSSVSRSVNPAGSLFLELEDLGDGLLGCFDGNEAADGDIAFLADGGAGAAFAELVDIFEEPRTHHIHGEAVESADFDEVVE